MKPKYQAEWNEHHTQLNLNLKHNDVVEIEQIVQNGSKVQQDQHIANFKFNGDQIRKLQAPRSGYIQWSMGRLEPRDIFQTFGIIQKNQDDSGSTMTEEEVLQLNVQNIGQKFTSQLYLKKWKISCGSGLTQGIIGYYEDEFGMEQELKCSEQGIVEWLAEPKKNYNQNDILLRLRCVKHCRHLKIENNRCLYCNGEVIQKQNQESCFPGWQLDEESAICYSKEIISDILVNKRKLVMVLDLDQTILHAIKTMKECNLQEDSIIEMAIDQKSKFLIKLRPYYEEFFIKLLPLYEIYIYTKASRSYAEHILNFITAKLQDKLPQHCFPLFPRVYSREDTNCQNSKSLHRLFYPGIADHLMVILDDNPFMWSKFKFNLIHTKPFSYFKEHSQEKDGQGIQEDIEKEIEIESKYDFWLHSVSALLEQLAKNFWESVEKAQDDPNYVAQDPRVLKRVKLNNKKHINYHSNTLLDTVIKRNISVWKIYQEKRSHILEGVSLFFAISASHSEKEQRGLEQAKEQAYFLGAKIYNEYKDSLILLERFYLITKGRKKIKSIQSAIENKVPIIHYKWIDDCDSHLYRFDYQDYIEYDDWEYKEQNAFDNYMKQFNQV